MPPLDFGSLSQNAGTAGAAGLSAQRDIDDILEPRQIDFYRPNRSGLRPKGSCFSDSASRHTLLSDQRRASATSG